MEDAIDSIGMAATGGIIAREVNRMHADGSDHEGGPCANCGTILTGKYCVECGQHGHVHRTVGALFHDILHGVFHFEGRVWHTLPMLAFRPGELTRRYAQGERVRFVSPMALFLFSVFIMFAASGAITKNIDFGASVGPEAGEVIAADWQKQQAKAVKAVQRIRRIDARTQRGEPDEDDAGDRPEAIERLTKARAEMAKLESAGKALGVDVRARAKAGTGAGAQESFEEKFNHAKNNPALMAYKIKSYGYKYSWALIPISLPFIWLLFPFRRKTGMYDHAIFATYSLAFMMLMVTVLATLYTVGVPAWPLWTAFALIPPIHMYRQLKGAYQIGRFGALWRTFALLNMVTISGSLFFALLMYLGTAD